MHQFFHRGLYLIWNLPAAHLRPRGPGRHGVRRDRQGPTSCRNIDASARSAVVSGRVPPWSRSDTVRSTVDAARRDRRTGAGARINRRDGDRTYVQMAPCVDASTQCSCAKQHHCAVSRLFQPVLPFARRAGWSPVRRRLVTPARREAALVRFATNNSKSLGESRANWLRAQPLSARARRPPAKPAAMTHSTAINVEMKFLPHWCAHAPSSLLPVPCRSTIVDWVSGVPIAVTSPLKKPGAVHFVLCRSATPQTHGARWRSACVVTRWPPTSLTSWCGHVRRTKKFSAGLGTGS